MASDMARKNYIILFCLLLGAAFATSCVHEFPDPYPNEVTLTLRFDMELPFYKEYIVDTRATADDSYRQRYILKGYTLYDDGTIASEPSFTQVWYGPDINNPDCTVTFQIPAGQWRLAAWSDIVPGSAEQWFYDASSFAAITYSGTYQGYTDMRDAWRGTLDFLAEPETFEGRVYNEVIDMTRPLAKYIFVSTDLEEFIKHYVRIKNANGAHITADDVDLSQFRVVFFYSGYMPNTYNLLLDRPVDSATGVRFEGGLTLLEDGTVAMGFDYTMVRTTESSVLVTVGVFDADGTQLSMSPGIEVPLMRSKYTIVKGRFLVTGSSSGVAINPEFDGEFNIIIAD